MTEAELAVLASRCNMALAELGWGNDRVHVYSDDVACCMYAERQGMPDAVWWQALKVAGHPRLLPYGCFMAHNSDRCLCPDQCGHERVPPRELLRGPVTCP